MNPTTKKTLSTLLKLVILDVIVIGYWTLYFKPSDDMTIALIFIIPAVFIANLVIACIIFFIKRYYTIFFVINAFIAPVILFLFFGIYIRINYIIYWESWNFYINENKYDISYSPFDKERKFSITYTYKDEPYTS